MINELKLHLSKLIKDYTKRKYLLAVSGGVDSVVLVALFKDLGLEFAIAHCNFQLRGVDSDADERSVSILTQKMQRDFFLKRFDTESYAESRKVSIQMAARELRYKWFQELVDEKGFDFIVTAHHKNDLAETILLNLVKGTGHAGLAGIKAVNDRLLRPLLIFGKHELEVFAEQHGLNWREDSSNSLDKYQRNHLRLNVMPLLKEINPKAEEAFSRTAEKMTAANEFIQYQMEKLKKEYVGFKAGGVLEISYKILETDAYLAFVLSELLRDYGFDYHKCVKIAEHDRSEPGASFLSEGHHLVCGSGAFVLAPILNNTVSTLVLQGIPASFTFASYTFETETREFEEGLDLSKWDLLLPARYLSEKLIIRYAQAGDSMAPYGMNGKRKKIADVLNDAKIPLNLKNYIPIFQIEDEIFWVVGIRSSQFCKVEKGENVVVVKAIHH